MEELIKIERSEGGKQVCSARELHKFLHVKTHFGEWLSTQVERAMLIENQDFERLSFSLPSGQRANDAALTVSSAKEISMLNGGERGKQARLYFLECEKIAQNKNAISLPTTYLDALKELVAKEEQVLLLQEKNEKLQFRSDFVDVCFDTDGLFSMEEVSKILKLPYGRNKMMDKLRKAGVLLSSNTPKQGMIKNGYFKVVETMVQNGDFKKLVSTTYATQKGIGHIHKILNK